MKEEKKFRILTVLSTLLVIVILSYNVFQDIDKYMKIINNTHNCLLQVMTGYYEVELFGALF